MIVLVIVLALAVLFLIRGAWWISAMLIVLEIALEGGMHIGRRTAKREANAVPGD